jgi:nitric oxide reductase NorQ protein
MLVVSYNPGYQNLLKGMKPSTRQRFISMRFDYPDIDTETLIIQQETEIDTAMATHWKNPLQPVCWCMQQP